jgi:hypothetical protein
MTNEYLQLQQRIADCTTFNPAERHLMICAIQVYASMRDVSAANAALPQRRNRLDRITSLHAAISSDEEGEGLCAAPIGPQGMTIPLIAADAKRLSIIQPAAQAIASRFDMRVQMAVFKDRQDLEVYQP